MSSLRPFFSYYGGKWRAAKLYPEPQHDTIIEPFAGGAGYSVRHHTKRVILVERDPKIAAVWRYLIGADPARLLSLPDVDENGVDVLDISDPEKWLIGFWLNAACTQPVKRPSKWARSSPKANFWGDRIRTRLAAQVCAIRHWTVLEADWHDAPFVTATWFVDPPYNNAAGSHYKHGPDALDFGRLATACAVMPGQVIVCENEGADWLPFRFLANIQATPKHGARRSAEVVWP